MGTATLTPSRLRTARAQFLVECLDLQRATGVDDARWEPFQLRHLNDDGVFRIERKSRQIAWSWLVAAEAVANAVLHEEGTIFVSINQDEAKEKLRYARHVLDALRVSGLPKLTVDNQLELEFDNGARLLSLPSTPPRGKARMHVRLDEFAHVRRDREIYTAMLPVISKGGTVRIGSSPMGAGGVFWEVDTERIQPYPGYTRHHTPWWETYAFCTDPVVARFMAPTLATAERVARYGDERIAVIHANMPTEDFAQEYECAYTDEQTAWITWDDLKRNGQHDHLWLHATARGTDLSAVYDAIDDVRRLVAAGTVEATFGAGLDIGRTRNTTELFLVGISTTQTYPLRLALTLDNVAYDDQFAVLARVLNTLPVTKVCIDRNGIGNNLAENAATQFPVKAEGVDFTNDTKRHWATDVKMLMQQGKTPLPVDRELSYQIHSIKRTVTPSKNLVFDTERNEKHHADKFWSWALALYAARMASKPHRPPPSSRAARIGRY